MKLKESSEKLILELLLNVGCFHYVHRSFVISTKNDRIQIARGREVICSDIMVSLPNEIPAWSEYEEKCFDH